MFIFIYKRLKFNHVMLNIIIPFGPSCLNQFQHVTKCLTFTRKQNMTFISVWEKGQKSEIDLHKKWSQKWYVFMH